MASHPPRNKRAKQAGGTSRDAAALGDEGGGPVVICCVVENRARQTCVAKMELHNITTLEVFTVQDGPSYEDTLEVLAGLRPDEVLLHSSACNAHCKTMLTRKIERLRDANNGIPEVRPVSRTYFDQDRGAALLKHVSRVTLDAEVLSKFTVLGASHCLLKFIESLSAMTFAPRTVNVLFVDDSADEFLHIDHRTALALELVGNARGEGVSKQNAHSLFATINKTKTAGGARLLRGNLLRPSCNPATIEARLDAVNYLLEHEDTLVAVGELLKKLPDLDRTLNRLVATQEGRKRQDAAKQVGVNVRTVIVLKHTLLLMEHLALALDDGRTEDEVAMEEAEAGLEAQPRGGSANSELLQAIRQNLVPPCVATVLAKIDGLVTDSTQFRKNGQEAQHQECFAVAAGADGILDVARKTYLQTVEEIYAEASALGEAHDLPLKVHYSSTRGYHLRVPVDHADALSDEFVQCVRGARAIACTTKHLASLSDRSREAIQEALHTTDRITQELVAWIQGFLPELFAQAESAALLDLLVSFADHVALTPYEYSRPMCPCSGALVIVRGRHPVIETCASDGAGLFVPNNTVLDEFSNLHVISGINGAGKSTYLRQVAQIVVLAQIGSYVPAAQAQIPARTRLLSRLGTGDDLENNISTFLMEMRDAAHILRHVGDKALVLIDELGRGTSNKDGSALAWAVAEVLQASPSLTLLATHHPLLLGLGELYPNVRNVHLSIDVKSDGDSSSSLYRYRHTLEEGPSKLETDYGIDLAERVGIQRAVLEHARALKQKVEASAGARPVCASQAADTAGENEARAVSAQLNQLMRHLALLKGSTLDDGGLRKYLHKLRADIDDDAAAKMVAALQTTTAHAPSSADHSDDGKSSPSTAVVGPHAFNARASFSPSSASASSEELMEVDFLGS